MTTEHDSRWHDADWRSRFRKKILRWFDNNSRDLPWRKTRDPYHVWISEIMLQQTQVSTVIPYFEKFTLKFPQVTDLAKADEEEVLRLWEGLGYYRRARQMHGAAKKIAEVHGGNFPETFDEVLALPGIGRYTAGAILSISKDQRLPVVEANTLRLYSRLIALRDPPTKAPAQRVLWEFAERVLPRSGSGKFNQAAMELGSLVCTPRDPDCTGCPLNSSCATFELGLQKEIPGKVKKIQYEDRNEVAIVVHDGPRVLVRQCQPGERWAGLWDFPRCEVASNTDSQKAARQHLRDSFSQRVRSLKDIATIRHGVTKYRISLTVLECQISGTATCVDDSAQWLEARQIGELPLSTTGRKIANLLTK